MKRLAIILALMGGPVGAQETLTGNDILEVCSKFDDAATLDNAVCLGYTIGAWHGLRQGVVHAAMVTKFVPGDTKIGEAVGILLQVCMPDGIPNNQTVAIILKHLRDTPSRRHLPITWTIPDALGYAFPCE